MLLECCKPFFCIENLVDLNMLICYIIYTIQIQYHDIYILLRSMSGDLHVFLQFSTKFSCKSIFCIENVVYRNLLLFFTC